MRIINWLIKNSNQFYKMSICMKVKEIEVINGNFRSSSSAMRSWYVE